MPRRKFVPPFIDYSRRFLEGTYLPSTLTEEEVVNSGRKMGLPDGYKVRTASKDELPNTVLDANNIFIYWDQVRLGLTYSKLKILGPILNHLQMNLAMLTPNFVHAVIIIYQFCLLYRTPWCPEIFLHLFCPRTSLSYAACRPRSGKFTTIGLDSSIHGWKVKYFVIYSPKGWDFPNNPGVTTKEIVKEPECPEALKTWFDNHDRPVYILDAATSDLLTAAKAKELMERKKTRGKGVEESSVMQKRKLVKLAEGQPKLKKRVVQMEKVVYDSSSDSSSSSSSSSSNSNSSDRASADVDVTGDEGEPRRASGADRERESGPSLHFINDSGNMEIRNNVDLSLINNPYHEFGPALNNFIKSEEEIAHFQRMDRTQLSQLFHSLLISASRVGSFFHDTGIQSEHSIVKLEKDFTRATDINKKLLHQVTTLEEKVQDLSNNTIRESQIQNLTAELKDSMIMVDVAAELNTEQKSIIEKLSVTVEENEAALKKKDEQIAELTRQLKERPSTSQVLSEEDQLNSLKDTSAYGREMVYFMKQGFEMFRRATLRQFKKPEDIIELNQIEFYKAEQEEASDEDE